MKTILSHINEILIALGTLGTLGGGWFAWKRKTKKDKVEVRFQIDKEYEKRVVELSEINSKLHETVFDKTSEAAKYKLILIQLPVDCPECAECIKKITTKLWKM
tara:strand:- start:3173 stop:3484 length:312 start_codon:yes stop_codon:yes gene_type:complete